MDFLKAAVHWIVAAYAMVYSFYPFDGERMVETQHNTYKSVENESLSIEFYLPDAPRTGIPMVVAVHGGLWWAGRTFYLKPFARYLAQRGTGCALVDFRRMPKNGFEDQAQDIKDAVRYVREHSPSLGVDPERLGIMGISSGAHLAALAAMTGDGDGYGNDPPGSSSKVKAAAYIYGAYDFITQPADRISRAILDSLRVYLSTAPPGGLTPEAFASPVTFADHSDPTTLIVHGRKDEIVPWTQAVEMQQALANEGVATELIGMAGYAHGFWELCPWLWPVLFDKTGEFFRRSL